MEEWRRREAAFITIKPLQSELSLNLLLRMLGPRGLRCGPPFQSPEEGGRRLGGHREEKQFVGRTDEEFYSVWRGSEAKEESGFRRGASGITSP